jgi:hypothetical protein
VDEQVFAEYLERNVKRSNRRTRAIKSVQQFERHLSPVDKTADQAEPVDLERFLEHHARKRTAKYEVQDLWRYYDATGNDRMKEAVDEMRYRFTPPCRLSRFLDVDPDHLETLKGLGIVTNNQLLYAADTPDKRAKLAEETGMPLPAIEKLVKLSDLARLFGVKGVRAKLYYESGVDSVEKMARWDAMALCDMLVEFVETTGFPGIATLPKEAESTVDLAKKLPIVVEFEDV